MLLVLWNVTDSVQLKVETTSAACSVLCFILAGHRLGAAEGRTDQNEVFCSQCVRPLSLIHI